jgi:KDO2-lipid IV(A) lauroyltransferase
LRLLSYLPLSVLYAIASFLYYVFYDLAKYRRDVVRKNLTSSFPHKTIEEIIVIEKGFYRHLTDLMVEILKMSTMSETAILKRVKMKNFDLVEEYFAKGQSALACAGHYGNWELAMVAAGIKFSARAHVIYKPLKSEGFGAFFNRLRSRFGNVLVPMRQTLRQVAATKNDITLFCFASDQTPGRAEVQYRLNFLNQSTAVLLGLEKIAKITNRPVFYFDIRKVKRGYYEIECVPLCLNPKATEEHEITDLFFKHLEHSIQLEPAHWLWSHKRWKVNDVDG